MHSIFIVIVHPVHVSLSRFYVEIIGIFFLLETAMNIGYSCHMLTDDMNDIFVISGRTVTEVREELRYLAFLFINIFK